MLLSTILGCTLLLRLTSSATIPASSEPACPRGFLSGPNQPVYGCTDSIDWLGDGYSNEDCRAAVQKFYFIEVAKHGEQNFEFLLPGATRKTINPPMQTPRRYTVGQ